MSCSVYIKFLVKAEQLNYYQLFSLIFCHIWNSKREISNDSTKVEIKHDCFLVTTHKSLTRKNGPIFSSCNPFSFGSSKAKDVHLQLSYISKVVLGKTDKDYFRVFFDCYVVLCSFYKNVSCFTPVLCKRIILSCFYLPIFFFGKILNLNLTFSVCRKRDSNSL